MSSRLTRPNASVTVMSARTVDDGPPALQEIRHSLPGVKRFPEAPLEIVLPGGQGEGRRTVTHPSQPRDNPAASTASFQPPHRPVLSNLPHPAGRSSHGTSVPLAGRLPGRRHRLGVCNAALVPSPDDD